MKRAVMVEDEGRDARYDKPVPDPTALTTELLRREIEALQSLLGARLDAMEQATLLRLEATHEIPAQIQSQVGHLAAIHDRDIATIGLRFDERDVRTSQAAESSQKALDAALLAAAALVSQQNEANTRAAEKVELSATKQIDQIVVLIQNAQKGTDDRILELKERVDRGEGAGVGSREYRVDNRASASLIMAAGGTLLALIAIIASVILTVVFH